MNKLKKQRNELRDLFNEWDPYNVSKDGLTKEYDSCVDLTLVLLRRNASAEEVTSELSSHIKENFEMDASQYGLTEQINKILNWWKSQPK